MPSNIYATVSRPRSRRRRPRAAKLKQHNISVLSKHKFQDGYPKSYQPPRENMTSPFVVETTDEVNLILDSWCHRILEENKVNTGKYVEETEWVLPGSKKFSDHFKKFSENGLWQMIMGSTDRVVMRHTVQSLIIQAHRESRLVKVKAHYFYDDTPKYSLFESLMGEVTEGLEPADSTIEWVYEPNGASITIPLSRRGVIRSAYPWIKDIPSYIDEYLDASASVLVLIGPPGTGKTSLIKEIITQRGLSAYVTYDPKLLENDRFFAMFMEGETDILIMEDADAFLADRKEGNTMMHRFLNMSDGLVTCKGKKLIFSTNLPNITDVDPALIRPGRCFDVLTHRPLSRDESIEVLREMGREEVLLGDKKSYTLAEVLQQQPHRNEMGKPAIGFVR